MKEKIIESQRRIIDILSECEYQVSVLYKSYSNVLPKRADFWEKMSDKERQHSTLLKKLHAVLDGGHLFVGIGRFDIKTILQFLELINQSIEQSKHPSFTEENAIKTALHIEASIIDSSFYDIVQSDTQAYRQAAEILSKDTEKHIKGLQQQLLLSMKEHQDDEK